MFGSVKEGLWNFVPEVSEGDLDSDGHSRSIITFCGLCWIVTQNVDLSK